MGSAGIPGIMLHRYISLIFCTSPQQMEDPGTGRSFPGQNLWLTDKELLMRQIMEAGFAMDDVVLFLDTHPENQDALRYYKAVRDMRDQSMAAYERRFGPLRYTDVTSMSWNWVTEKWPWEGGC